MKLYLAPVFQRLWRDKDPFTEVEQLQGEVFRQLESRKTLRFTLPDSVLAEHSPNNYFVKIHRGVGWFEIVENLLRLRLPVLGARNEYEAIKKLETLQIPTMKIAGFGECGFNPATRRSFIITEELVDTLSLEDYTANWTVQKPDPVFKRALISKLAYISQTIHQHGLNHRDYYICHFLLDISPGLSALSADTIKLSLIDLHRAQIRRSTPERWRVKDIASLYFSIMHLGLEQRDLFRFIREYEGLPLRQSLGKNKHFWSQVERRGQQLWQRKLKKGDAI